MTTAWAQDRIYRCGNEYTNTVNEAQANSRLILESELKKAEARRADLLKEYNNGEPEKLGPETRNQQKYLDRVAELKANIGRSESDIDGIRRELSRVPFAASSAPSLK